MRGNLTYPTAPMEREPIEPIELEPPGHGIELQPWRPMDVRLLNYRAVPGDGQRSLYRFLVDNMDVKYVTVDPGTLPWGSLTSAPDLIASLPPFPRGHWNVGHVGLTQKTAQRIFYITDIVTLPGVEDVRLDNGMRLGVPMHHLHFEVVERLALAPNIFRGRHPHAPGMEVVVKYAAWPDKIKGINAEAIIYRRIFGHGIGPRFLGLVNEGSRFIGFAREQVQGRRPVMGDLEACQATLDRLHVLSIVHHDPTPHFVVRPTRGVVLVDFAEAAVVVKEDNMCWDRWAEDEKKYLRTTLGQ